MLQSGSAVSSLHLDRPEPVPRVPEDIPRLFGPARDFEFMAYATREAAAQRLALATRREQALDCLLILLERDYPEDIRTDAAVDLAELLSEASVAEQLEAVMYSAPLPRGTDLPGAVACAHAQLELRCWLERLGQLQATIRGVRETWIAAASALSDRDRDDADAATVRCGAYRDLVLAIDGGQVISQAIVRLLTRPELTQRLPQHIVRTLFLGWQAELKSRFGVEPSLLASMKPLRSSSEA